MATDYTGRMIGNGNPAWRGKKWGYKGRRWTELSRLVIERDGCCADCGALDGLVAHHLIPQRFWLNLDAANVAGNLLALCGSCHVKRPEHFWIEMPDDVFDIALHSRLPPERFRARLKPKPVCECGRACTQHRNTFCSYACAAKAKWRAGIYSPEKIVRNLHGRASAERERR